MPYTIGPPKLDKHSELLVFLRCRENLFTQIEATPYYATRQERKRRRICDVTIERDTRATQFELPTAGIGIHPSKANNEDTRPPTRFHEGSNI